MKKLKLIFILLLLNISMFSQNVGINATGVLPADCSMLYISSMDKGLLIPHVSLTDILVWLPLTGIPVDGLTVYSISNPIGGFGTGFYYWSTSVSKWIKISDNLSPNGQWLLGGNSGTIPGTDYLGTVDLQDLVFKTNAIERIRILSTGNVGIGTSNPLSLLHVDGVEQLGTASNLTGTLKFYNSLSANVTAFQAGNATSAVTYTLPLSDGTAGQILTTDGFGNLSWQSRHQVLGPFEKKNMPSNQTDQLMKFPDENAGTLGTARIRMPYNGIIKGMTVSSSTPLTSGSATFQVFKNGVDVGVTCDVVFINGDQYKSTTSGIITFVSGDILDIRYTTSPWFNPTSADFLSLLIVDWTQ